MKRKKIQNNDLSEPNAAAKLWARLSQNPGKLMALACSGALFRAMPDSPEFHVRGKKRKFSDLK